FSLKGQPFARKTAAGTVQIADSRNFHVSKTIASALVTLRPGALRELHWHPNADEWVYFIKGTAQVGVFAAGPKAVTTNFKPGDADRPCHPRGWRGIGRSAARAALAAAVRRAGRDRFGCLHGSGQLRDQHPGRRQIQL